MPPGCAPSPRVAHTRTPVYETPAAHKGLIPPLCAMPCFLIPALVCDAVLPDSGPCVRHREGRAVTGHAPRPAGPEGEGCADARYRHRRALLTPARVISPSRCQRLPRDVDNPLAVRTTPSRCRQPPRGVNDPLAMSTTPSRCQRPPRGADNARPSRQRASVRRARSRPSPSGGAQKAASRGIRSASSSEVARPSRARRRCGPGPSAGAP